MPAADGAPRVTRVTFRVDAVEGLSILDLMFDVVGTLYGRDLGLDARAKIVKRHGVVVFWPVYVGQNGLQPVNITHLQSFNLRQAFPPHVTRDLAPRDAKIRG